MPFTRRGWIHVPPFAIVAYTEAICRGETVRPCPYATVASVAFVHDARLGTTPAVSPGNPSPVGRPNPNFAR